MNLKALFFRSINFGIQEDQSFHDKRRIKSVNFLNLVVLAFLLIGLTNWFFIRDEFPLAIELTFIFITILSIFLSYKNRTSLAFSIFTINVNIALFFVCKYYPDEVGSHLFYFPLIVSIVLLNNPSVIDKHFLLHLFTCATFFLLNIFVDLPAFQTKTLSPESIRVMWIYNMIMSVGLTAMITYLLNKTIFNQNKEILSQFDDLKKTKEEVNLSLKEKEILLAELHHRVKNNLAIISGLLNLQEDAINNHEAKQVISETKDRIMSMALVHKMLFKNPEFKKIDFGKYSSELISELFNSYNLAGDVTIEEDYDAINLSISVSIPLGLILNEIVTNSIKYGFKDEPAANNKFYISIKKENNFVSLIVKDSGKGFDKDLNTDLETSSLGIVLIKSLTQQIEGKVLFSNNNGAKIEINFPNN
ncbi:MAG: sensor histidine kinase [Bacteroidia bacterium]|nr:sensor histidine kinase [Bacteroidia bacterium]